MTPATRLLGALTFPEISGTLKPSSVLCLPLGAFEQHGAHLPLNTDVIVAEGLTRALVARFGDQLDLWQLPSLPIGLSREHDWAPGTLSLSIQGFVGLLREFARELVRAQPARNLAIVNGHGGNRGMLENLLQELRTDFALNTCVLHPFDLCKAATGANGPDVHGGRAETAVMLALAPDLVRRELIASPSPPASPEAIAALIYDRGVTWPWRTDDPRLAHNGIIGDPHGATPELGRAIVDSIVEQAGVALARLLEHQRSAPSSP